MLVIKVVILITKLTTRDILVTEIVNILSFESDCLCFISKFYITFTILKDRC